MHNLKHFKIWVFLMYLKFVLKILIKIFLTLWLFVNEMKFFLFQDIKLYLFLFQTLMLDYSSLQNFSFSVCKKPYLELDNSELSWKFKSISNVFVRKYFNKVFVLKPKECQQQIKEKKIVFYISPTCSLFQLKRTWKYKQRKIYSRNNK